ncbi:hypothetical protein SCLCIDRAFT_145968 [Scleroderma citrinum Foug A]|uniref:Uncharacterized protein n=1 Tax=Scleroderma citrinum Foug A TaxID=1036808 RepID=A0A0C3CNR0_9AGAM|nr:hypothetical protein SCLCIDRAFT_145968 [Scleroderma citrinum Foug A]
MDSRGALPFLLKTTLEDYHTTESLVYEELTFNLGTDTKLSRWRDSVRKLGTRLNAHKFARKIIFVTVHSDLTRGDLFAGKDENEGDVSAEVEDFMTCLFSSPLEDIVHASTLFMLTCGPLVTFQESFLKLKTSISRLRPEYTIAFTQTDFISAAVKLFIVAYGIQVLIEGHVLADILQDLLDVSLDLRMHSDVVLFHIQGIRSSNSVLSLLYAWYHSYCHPWGIALPMGCPQCRSIRPWSRSKGDPKGTHPKARVSTCQSIDCGFEARLKPLLDKYEIVSSDRTSGWLKYIISAAETL